MLNPVEWLNKENLKHTALASVKFSSLMPSHMSCSFQYLVWIVLPSLCLCSLIYPSWNLTLLGIHVSCIIRIMSYVWTLKTSKTVPEHLMGIQLMVLPLATFLVSIGTVNFLFYLKKNLQWILYKAEHTEQLDKCSFFLHIDKILPDCVMHLFSKVHLPQSLGSCVSHFLTPVTQHQLYQLMFHIL